MTAQPGPADGPQPAVGPEPADGLEPPVTPEPAGEAPAPVGGPAALDTPPAEPGPSLRRVFEYGFVGALGVLVVYIGALAVHAVLNLLVQVLIAVFIAISLDPAVRWMIKRRVRRGQAVAVILLFAVIAVAGLLWLVLPPLIHQGPSLASDFPGYLNRLRERSPSLQHLE